jgi:hypothetical protein
MESMRRFVGFTAAGGASTKGWGIISGLVGCGEMLPSITTPYALDCADSAD